MDPGTSAAIDIASQVATVGMQDAKNLRQYNRQRKDALDDWHRQNQYNSPVQQMARLKEAGLNPALMYGKSGGTGQAESVRGSERVQSERPDIKGGMAYAELELMKSQLLMNESTAALNNLKGATEAKQTALVQQQTAKTESEAQSAAATAEIAKELVNASLQAQLADVDQKKAATGKTLVDTKKSAAEIGSIKASTEGTKASTEKTKAETQRLTATQQSFIKQEEAKVAQLRESIKFTRLQQDSEYAKRIGTEIDNVINSLKADAAQQGINMESMAGVFGSLLNTLGKIEQTMNFTSQPSWMSDYVYQELRKHKNTK